MIFNKYILPKILTKKICIKNLNLNIFNDIIKLTSNELAGYNIEKIINENDSVINWFFISRNPAAINVIYKNIDKINWSMLSANPAAIDLIERVIKYNIDKIHWGMLSSNSESASILLKNYKKINWYQLSNNRKAFDIILENLSDDLGLDIN